MFRTSSSPAVVLHQYRVGEAHKGLTLLTPDRGLLQALAHGAYQFKSRFRTLSEPFSHVRVYLYHDPVKDQYKVTDMEALELFEGLRASLVKFYTASLWAEAVLKSFAGGGESVAAVFELLVESLGCLERAAAGREGLISAQFLFRLLGLMGYSPELERCGLCERDFEEGEESFFSGERVALECAGCAAAGSFRLPPGGRRYLQKTLTLPLEQAVRIGLGEASRSALKELGHRFIQAVLEVGLNTLRSGAGIL